MKVLIVDASILIYANFFAVGHLATTKGEPTGLRYGFLRAIRSHQNAEQANKVFICYDSAGPVVKASEVANYKSDRDWTTDKQTMYGQVPALKKLMEQTKYDQVEAEGYEADDCIAYVTSRVLAQGDHEVCILTSDNDLCQLIGPKVYVRDPGKSKAIKDEKWVMDNFGCWASQLLMYRTMIGDVSDNLTGVINGKSSVQKELLQALLSLPRYPQTPIDPETLRKAAESLRLTWITECFEDPEFKEHIDSNYKVMSLHLPPNPKVTKGRKDKEGLEAQFREMEFNPTGPRSMWKFIPEFVGG